MTRPTVRLPYQPQWLGYRLDRFADAIQAHADRTDQTVMYDLNGIDIVCHPGEPVSTAIREWREADERRLKDSIR